MSVEELAHLLPSDFDHNSRVWIYQSNRPFGEREQLEINEQLVQFYSQWAAHGAPVKGWAGILFAQFIVFIADETDVKVSGCSTDASVRVIKSIERQYNVNMFDRLTITFLKNNKAEMLPFNQVQYAIDKGFINGHTYVFNNVVTTKKELLEEWLVPLNKSWLAGRVNLDHNMHA